MNKNILFLFFCLLLISCQNASSQKENISNTTKPEINEGLVLFNATLEQSNPEGKTLWKLGTEKVVYSQDKKTATLTKIKGNLFDKNELILQISADKGEIQQDGKLIFLQDNIIAFDPRNKAELKLNNLEWQPDKNILIIKNGITVNHEKMVVKGIEAIYFTDKEQLEIKQNVVATTNDPKLQLITDHLFWDISKRIAIGDRPLKITRYEGEIITDQVTANQAQLDLNDKSVTIKNNINFKSLKPPLQAVTNTIFWKYKDRMIDSSEPIKLINNENNMTLTSNKAIIKLAENMAYLFEGIYGEAAKNEVKLYADNANWNITTNYIEANGNVFYEQLNPIFSFSGVKAVGQLNEKNITVTGDYQNKVVTEIVPEEKK